MALDFPASPSVDDLYTDSGRTWRWNGTGWAMLPGAPPDIDDWFVIAVSDETTDLATGPDKVYFRMPYAGTLLAVRASVNTAPTDANIEVDIYENTGGGPVSVLSTVLSIDASEKTSTTAAVPAVISDSALANDAEITIDIDQVGSTIKGKGLKVYLKTRRSA
jgi:hypothetical protein